MAEQKVKFVSKYANLTRVISPASHVYEGGRQVGFDPGKRAKFVDGKFETDDEEIIEALENTEGVWVDDGKSAQEIEEQEQESAEPALESLTKQELITLAQEKNVEVSDKLTKQEIINLLKSA